MKLIIGNKNYSSWSLRPWILMRVKDIAFEEERIPLYLPESKSKIESFSPAGKVPALIDNDLVIWDSLSIVEYLAERYPEKKLWPEDLKARTLARSITCEMHSGFVSLRKLMPMNVRSKISLAEITSNVQLDIQRIVNIWEDCRTKYSSNGPFLFGEFSIADAFYAPVASRFRTYSVQINSVCQDYVNTIHELPAMREWIGASDFEAESIAAFEITKS